MTPDDRTILPTDSVAFLCQINDIQRLYRTFGHQVTSTLLQQMPYRLQNAVANGHVYTLSHDSWVVLPQLGVHNFAALADALMQAVREQVFVCEQAMSALTISVGAAQATAPTSFGTLVAMTREALSFVQEQTQSYAFYQPQQYDNVLMADKILAQHIIGALHEKRVLPVYQPIVDAHSEEPVAWEMLARIAMPNGDLMPAAQFITSAEKNGLVGDIDLFMANHAIAVLTARTDLVLNVNVSAQTGSDTQHTKTFLKMLHGANDGVTKRLNVEITETAAWSSTQQAIHFVQALRDCGCTVVLDDFGVGNTSIASIKLLKPDVVKIDGLYIRNLSKSPENMLFVRSMTSLMQGLGMRTVAEMVGSAEDAALLRDYGVQAFQGYFYGMPQRELPATTPVLLNRCGSL